MKDRQEIIISTTPAASRWTVDENGIIYFSVTSDGTSGEKWMKRLASKGIGSLAKSVLLSLDFQPTSGIVNDVAVLPGSLFEDNERITRKIRGEAGKRKLSKPNTELACLIREKFTNKDIEDMGLCAIVAMHDPKKCSGRPVLLTASRLGVAYGLDAFYDRLNARWFRGSGFAFAVSQIAGPKM